MLEIDCSELTTDEQLALAGELTKALESSAIAFLKSARIVFDVLGGRSLDEGKVSAVVLDFIGRRKDAQHYSAERKGNVIVVHSPDPVAAAHGRRRPDLPPNLFKCPLCPFVTPYEEMYNTHYRAHFFGVS